MCLNIGSQGSVLGHDKLESILHSLDEDLSIVNVNIEFSLDGIMN